MTNSRINYSKSASDVGDDHQYMAKTCNHFIDALHIIATPDDVLLEFEGRPDTTIVLDAVWLRIHKIISFNEMGFLRLDDDGLDFNLIYCQPERSFDCIDRLSNDAIKEGVFAWALNQNRAVVLPGDENTLSRLFHVVAIRGKVIGMLVATFDFDADSINEITLGLLSIILLNCANTIEALELNIMVQEQNEMLEMKIEERTRQLMFEKVRAEAASIAKSNFLATVSHEIRTPMNGVLGMAQVIAATELTEKQQLYVNTIIDSGNSLLVIINDILDFSKIEAGKMELENHPFNLHKITADIVDLFGSKAKEKNIKLGYNIEPGCPVDLLGDSLRIKQIIQNLVSNAIKFTEQGSIKISISGTILSNDKATLMFNISDTGIGIDQQSQEKLFSDFTQVDSSTTRKFGGTGLGLAICKQLIMLMQGEIGVNSQPGQGAIFWFTLNLNVNKNIHAQVPEYKTGLTVKPGPLTGKVLLVEDNRVNQFVAKAMLEQFGLMVDIADNGLDAVKKYKNNAYDLILMDCQMPVLDGFEATKKIRENETETKTSQQIPIIALTANVHDKDREHCLAVGFDDYLSKPIVKSDLYKLIVKYLSRRKIINQK